MFVKVLSFVYRIYFRLTLENVVTETYCFYHLGGGGGGGGMTQSIPLPNMFAILCY